MVKCRTHYEPPCSQYLASRFLSLMSLSASLCSFFSLCWFNLRVVFHLSCLFLPNLVSRNKLSILYNRTLYPHALYIYTTVPEHFTLPYLPARTFHTCSDKMPPTFQLSFKPICIWYHYARCVILHFDKPSKQYNINCVFSYCTHYLYHIIISSVHHIMIGMNSSWCPPHGDANYSYPSCLLVCYMLCALQKSNWESLSTSYIFVTH